MKWTCENKCKNPDDAVWVTVVLTQRVYTIVRDTDKNIEIQRADHEIGIEASEEKVVCRVCESVCTWK